MTNREFAETNDDFHRACEAIGITPTVRQASKWRRGIGIARHPQPRKDFHIPLDTLGESLVTQN